VANVCVGGGDVASIMFISLAVGAWCEDACSCLHEPKVAFLTCTSPAVEHEGVLMCEGALGGHAHTLSTTASQSKLRL
jgi:hypothetical protein